MSPNLIGSLTRRWRSSRADRNQFDAICRATGLNLDFDSNRQATSILRDIFRNREYADFFPFYESSTIVDVGAHFGYFALFAATNSATESRIIAIEPSADNYHVLCENIAASRLKNITTLNAALSDTPGVKLLYQGQGGRSVNYSLFSKDCNALSSNQSEGVESLTLSDLCQKCALQQVDFLKMDCEGAEYGILTASDAETLGRIRTISLEFHDLKKSEYTPNKLAAHLERHGFKIVKFSYSSTGMNLNYGKLIATRGFA
jgi:FkbM family methyltransferase